MDISDAEPYSPPASGEVTFVDFPRVEAERASRLGMLPSLKRYPEFRLLWLSTFFFFGGIWTQTLILGWLVFNITNSEFMLALFTASRLGPMMLGPISGVIADRLDRARFMLVTVSWAFAAVTVVAILVSTHHITYWELVVGGFCIGLAQSPAQPARYALVSDIIGRRDISNANALNSMALNMTQVIGPAIGGAMIGLFGVPTALWIAALWYPISFITLWPIRDVGRAPKDVVQASPVRQLTEGIRIVLSDRMMASVLFVSLVANIFLWPVYQAFMPVFAKNILHLGPSGLGWLLTCSGLGALTGSLAIAFLGDFKHKGALFLFGTAAWGAFWALFALSRSVPLSFVLMACVGLASSTFGVLQSTLLLMLAPARVRGRAMGLQELAIGILPLATVLHGAVAGGIGVAMSTTLSGVLLGLIMIWLAMRVPGLRRYSGLHPEVQPS